MKPSATLLSLLFLLSLIAVQADAQDFVVITSERGYLLDKDDRVMKTVPFFTVMDVESTDAPWFHVDGGLKIHRAQVRYSADVDYMKNDLSYARKTMLTISECFKDDIETVEAIKILKRLSKEVNEAHKEQTPAAAWVLQFEAWFHYDAEDLDAANDALDAADTLLENLGKPRHLDAADVLNLRGLVRLEEGQDQEALRLFKEAFLIQTADLSDDHLDGATVLANMSFSYENIGDAAQAARAQLLATRSREKVLPSSAVKIPDSYSRLGDIYHSDNRYQDAITAFRKAVMLYKEHHVDKAGNVVTILMQIGETYELLEDYDQAERSYVESLEELPRMDEADALAFRKSILIRQGLLDHVRKLEDKAVEHFAEAEKLYNPSLPTNEDGETFENLSTVYSDQNDHENAKKALVKALKIYAQTDGENSDSVLRMDELIAGLHGTTDGSLDDVVMVADSNAYLFDDDGKLLTAVPAFTVLDWDSHIDETDELYGYYRVSYAGQSGTISDTQLRSGRMLPGYFEASPELFKAVVQSVAESQRSLQTGDFESSKTQLSDTIKRCIDEVGEESTLTLWVRMFLIRLQDATDGAEAAVEALTALKETITSREKGDYPIEIDAKLVAGSVLLKLEEPAAALEKFRTARELTIERLGTKHVDVMALNRTIAKVSRESGDIEGAAQGLREALAIAEEIYHVGAPEIDETKLALCIVLTQTESLNEALERLQAITDDADRLPPQLRVLSFALLGRVNLLLKRYDNAKELLPALLTQLQEMNAATSIPAVVVLSDLGRLAIVDEQWDTAVENLSQAIAVIETNGQTDSFEYGNAQLSLGIALSGKGEEQQAREQFAAAGETFSQLNRSESAEAKDAAARFAAIKPSPTETTVTPEPLDEAMALRLKAASDAFDQGRFADAKQLYQGIIDESSDDIKDPTIARAAAHLGIAKLSVKKDLDDFMKVALETAIGDLQKLGTAPDLLREALLLQAYMLVETRERPAVLSVLDRDLLKNVDAMSPQQQVIVLCLKSRALCLPTRALRPEQYSEIKEAVQLASAAHQNARDSFGPQHIYCASALDALGHALLSDGDETAAAKAFEESRQILRLYRNEIVAYQPFDQIASFLSTSQESLHEAVSPLRGGDTMEAALTWVLNEKNLLPAYAARESQVRRLTKSAALTTLPADVQKLVADPVVPYVTVQDIRNALKPDELLIEVIRLDATQGAHQLALDDWTEQDYFAWIIPPAGEGFLSATDLGNGPLLDRLNIDDALQGPDRIIRDVQENGEEKAASKFQRDLRLLAKQVWDPLTRTIPASTKTIIFSLDGDLQHVPWAALPVNNGGRLLIEEYAIRFVSSGRELVHHSNASRNRGQSLILANPDFAAEIQDTEIQDTDAAERSSGNPFPSINAPLLPGTEFESRAILSDLSRYAGSPPKRLTGSGASQSALLSFNNPYVLHLATHAIHVPQNDSLALSRGYELTESRVLLERNSDSAAFRNPLQCCGLLLAGFNRAHDSTKRPDGILTGEEIVAHDLHGTELVVLSGCPSDASKRGKRIGAGLLPDAFRLAGAKTVIAPIWEVADRESSQLMILLYKNLASGMSKSEALRQAQLSRIKSRTERYGAAHPFFWAGFRVNGLE